MFNAEVSGADMYPSLHARNLWYSASDDSWSSSSDGDDDDEDEEDEEDAEDDEEDDDDDMAGESGAEDPDNVDPPRSRCATCTVRSGS